MPIYHMWLRRALADRGIFQKDMAKTLGFDQSQMSNFIKWGRPILRPDQVVALHKRLDTNKFPIERDIVIKRLTERPIPDPKPRAKSAGESDPKLGFKYKRKRNLALVEPPDEAQAQPVVEEAHSEQVDHAQTALDRDTSPALQELKHAIEAVRKELGPGNTVILGPGYTVKVTIEAMRY